MQEIPLAEASEELVSSPPPLENLPSASDTRFIAFLIFWTISTLFIYSWAGEKMPWLTTHLAVPLILLTGWFGGRVIDGRYGPDLAVDHQLDAAHRYGHTRHLPVHGHGAAVEVETGSSIVSGTAVGVDRDGGALLVRTGPGEPLSAVAVGDVVRCVVADAASVV